jgi:LysR family glycine cleavage system transcriptional activator
MHRELPPFTAVRAFEASARHLSFKKAAAELCLTQSAISHQVKALEAYLGVQLFLREARGVVLTAEGKSYLQGLTSILDRMAEETERLRNSKPSGRLSIHAKPGFVARWLVPRLPAFRAIYPDIDVLFTPSVKCADFASEDVDIAIRWKYKPMPGLRVDPLIASSLFPVISHDLLGGRPVPLSLEDARHFPLLIEEGCRDLENWFESAGVPIENLKRGPSFAHYDHLIQAAAEGLGMALAYNCLVEADLAEGRLIKLFDLALPPRLLYSVVTPEDWITRPRIAAFRNWLLEEADKEGPARQLHKPGDRMAGLLQE